MSARSKADNHYVAVAARHGCRKGLARIIIKWARHYHVSISLAFALFEHESGFRKVFGHDPTIYAGAGLVTKLKFLAYRLARRRSGNRLMQGAGEGQLTWWQTQDLADTLGGERRPLAQPAVRLTHREDSRAPAPRAPAPSRGSCRSTGRRPGACRLPRDRARPDSKRADGLAGSRRSPGIRSRRAAYHRAAGCHHKPRCQAP
jgi:hypothetical protein